MKLPTGSVVEQMLAGDKVRQMLNIELEQLEAGSATMTLKITKDMLNGFAIAHGGIIFTLADSAFAFACNSRNQMTVSVKCTIQFERMVYEGDVLTATAKERSLSGRDGIYDVTVVNQKNETVAIFEGISKIMKASSVART